MIKRIDIPILIVIIIIASLLRKEYVETGHWMVVVTIGYFLVYKIVSLIGNYSFFKTLNKSKRVFQVSYILFIALLLFDTLYTHSVRYFVLVTILCVDYFYSLNPKHSVDSES